MIEPLGIRWHHGYHGRHHEIEGRAAMAFALYFHYDLERPFMEQVEENKALIQAVFRDRYHKNIRSP